MKWAKRELEKKLARSFWHSTQEAIDKLGLDNDAKGLSKQQKKQKINPRCTTNIVIIELHNILWDLSHQLTDHQSGKLGYVWVYH